MFIFPSRVTHQGAPDLVAWEELISVQACQETTPRAKVLVRTTPWEDMLIAGCVWEVWSVCVCGAVVCLEDRQGGVVCVCSCTCVHAWLLISKCDIPVIGVFRMTPPPFHCLPATTPPSPPAPRLLFLVGERTGWCTSQAAKHCLTGPLKGQGVGGCGGGGGGG